MHLLVILLVHIIFGVILFAISSSKMCGCLGRLGRPTGVPRVCFAIMMFMSHVRQLSMFLSFA